MPPAQLNLIFAVCANAQKLRKWSNVPHLEALQKILPIFLLRYLNAGLPAQQSWRSVFEAR